MGDRQAAADAAFRASCGDDAEALGKGYFGAVVVVELGGIYMPRDIATALEAWGYDPDLPRSEVAEKLGVTGEKHHPVVDARQSAAVYDAAKRRDPVLDQYRI